MNKINNIITSKSRRDDTLLTVDEAKRNLRTTTHQNHRIPSGMQPVSEVVELLRSSGWIWFINPELRWRLHGVTHIKPLRGFTGIVEKKYPARDKRLVEKRRRQEHRIPSGMQPDFQLFNQSKFIIN